MERQSTGIDEREVSNLTIYDEGYVGGISEWASLGALALELAYCNIAK